MRYILAFVISIVFSLILIPLIIRIANRLHVLKSIGQDRWSNRTVPDMGGVAIFIGFMLASAILVPFQRQTWVVLFGASVIFILGFLDDRYGTHPRIKFAVQFGVALGLALLGVRLRILPTYVAIPMTLLWIVGLTNAFNLIDNMDGLSGGTAFIASITFFFLSWRSGQAAISIMAIALAGGCLGFLVYNFNPARIFMGDCGSLFLGYALAVFGILEFWQKSSPVFPVLVAPALILGYAVFDTTLVTILRLKAKGPPWIGGKDHSSHRLAMLGLGERGAVIILYALSIVGSISAFVLLKVDLFMGVALVVLLAVLATVFGWFLWNRTEDIIDK